MLQTGRNSRCEFPKSGTRRAKNEGVRLSVPAGIRAGKPRTEVVSGNRTRSLRLVRRCCPPICCYRSDSVQLPHLALGGAEAPSTRKAVRHLNTGGRSLFLGRGDRLQYPARQVDPRRDSESTGLLRASGGNPGSCTEKSSWNALKFLNK